MHHTRLCPRCKQLLTTLWWRTKRRSSCSCSLCLSVHATPSGALAVEDHALDRALRFDFSQATWRHRVSRRMWSEHRCSPSEVAWSFRSRLRRSH